MTDALSGLDPHAQTNGSELIDATDNHGELSSQRASTQLAIGLITFGKF
ncbi:hypothetical protein CF161_29838 [Pseudomonas sp. CF161]|nr:hypothetical protein CF161_29838 [Pseudomonas sp. CF161]